MGSLKSKVTVSQAAPAMEGKFQCSWLVQNAVIFPSSFIFTPSFKSQDNQICFPPAPWEELSEGPGACLNGRSSKIHPTCW